MKSTCAYCNKPFDARAGAKTCSDRCRKDYSCVVKWFKLHPDAVKQPNLIERVQQVKPVGTPLSEQPIVKTAQPVGESRWQRYQTYKKRHKIE